MKKLFFVSTYILLALNSYSQCKYDRNDVDEFEKIKVVSTPYALVYHPTLGGHTAYLKMTNAGGYLFLTIKIINERTSFCISEDSELLLLTTGGEVTRLASNESLDCADLVKSRLTYDGQYSFIIDREMLQFLEGTDLEKIRLVATDRYIEFNLTKANLSKQRGMNYFKTNAKCILNL